MTNLAICSPLLIFAVWAVFGIWINRIPNVREKARNYSLRTHFLILVTPVRVWARRTSPEDVETLAALQKRFLLGLVCGISVTLLIRYLAVRFLTT
jgi:hypothetical protein